MRFSTLLDRPILLLGGGREGGASLSALVAAGHPGPIYVTGDSPQTLDGADWVDPSALHTLPQNTVMIRSPGFPPHHRLRQSWRGEDTSATRIGLSELAALDIPVIGITGSKGKSTMSTLVEAILKASGVPASLVGNIGLPLLAELESIKRARPVVVMELSSYHCDDLGDIPLTTAVLGRLFPEHLNWHGSLQAYYGAKLNLLQSARLRIIDERALETLKACGLHDRFNPLWSLERVNQKTSLHFEAGQFFDGVTPLTHDVMMNFTGQHNRENACLAYAAARTLGGTLTGFQEALRTAKPLPFRLESEGLIHGIEWINDSISTAPEASAAALDAYGVEGVHTLIVGGQDRHYDYAPLMEALHRNRTTLVIGIPETGHGLKTLGVRYEEVNTLEEAVQLALHLTPIGQRCVFSPGAPSYHQWSGFEARGLALRKFIKAARS